MKRKIILIAILTLSLILSQITGATFADTNIIAKDNAEIRIIDNASKTNFDYSSRKLLKSVTFYIDDNGIARKSTQEDLTKNSREESIEYKYYYDGINSNNEPQYTVELVATLSKNIRKTTLYTKAQGVDSWASNTKTHCSKSVTNSITYSYVNSNPPSNPYVRARAKIRLTNGTTISVPQETLYRAE